MKHMIWASGLAILTVVGTAAVASAAPAGPVYNSKHDTSLLQTVHGDGRYDRYDDGPGRGGWGWRHRYGHHDHRGWWWYRRWGHDHRHHDRDRGFERRSDYGRDGDYDRGDGYGRGGDYGRR